MVAKQQIIDFLREAHINSWPDNIAPVDKPGLYGFEETHFSRGAWDFYDLYGGRVTDIGFEAIYFEKQPVWGRHIAAEFLVMKLMLLTFSIF